MLSDPPHKIWPIIIIWPLDPLRAHNIINPIYMNRFSIIACSVVFRIRFYSTDSYRSRVWQCNGKYDKSRPRCETPALREEDIKQRFLAAFNSLLTNKEAYIAACEVTRVVLTDTAVVDAEMKELLSEMEIVAGLTKKCIDENSTAAQDQDEYAERYNGYVERYEKAKARYDKLAVLRKEKQTRAGAIDRFMAELRKRDELLTVFDNRLWLTMVDYAEVKRDGTLVFHFYDGTEIKR